VLDKRLTEKVKINFLLFDEIEKASDALWNLLLGILDKATLTLGDNSRVDFSRSLIFMTSNLGAAEMGSILRPTLGFASGETERANAAGVVDGQLNGKIARAGVEAARRKFTPEFMNRIDKVVVFKPLGAPELRKILTLELNMVQQRVFTSSNGAPFVFTLTDRAKSFLLREGTDLKYGARHLKRAVDRVLVHPLSNLIATGQVRGGDLIAVDFDPGMACLTFVKEAEDMPDYAMARMVDISIPPPCAHSAGAVTEIPRVANAKTTRR
jgi:ATP-dependent Clp protease ATP-binding subunit ClpB